jgi:site-specific DNA recombinase
MLANRLYLGQVVFRDITTANAHPALVEPDLFEQCQAILTARAQAHSQRAASNSDYHLTGLITCPHCGNKYIGTAATGKLRRYRYDTCFARTRYGSAGCTAARMLGATLDEDVGVSGGEDLLRATLTGCPSSCSPSP